MRRDISLLARHIATSRLVLREFAFGEVIAAICSGSVVAGYGNEGSDIDLYIISASSQLHNYPNHILVDGLVVDIEFFSIETIGAWVSHFTQFSDSPSRLTQTELPRSVLVTLSRILQGIVLATSSYWDEVIKLVSCRVLRQILIAQDAFQILSDNRDVFGGILMQDILLSDEVSRQALLRASEMLLASSGETLALPSKYAMSVLRDSPELVGWYSAFHQAISADVSEQTLARRMDLASAAGAHAVLALIPELGGVDVRDPLPAMSGKATREPFWTLICLGRTLGIAGPHGTGRSVSLPEALVWAAIDLEA